MITNTPYIYTGSNVTYSGLITKNGPIYINSKNVPIYVNIFNDSYEFYNNKTYKINNKITNTIYPLTQQDLNCTTSGCTSSINYVYFSYINFSGSISKIVGENNYVFAATEKGISIFSTINDENIGLVSKYDNIIDITINNTFLYFSRSNVIYYVSLEDINNTCSNIFCDFTQFIKEYYNSSDTIKNICCNNNIVVHCTSSDIYVNKIKYYSHYNNNLNKVATNEKNSIVYYINDVYNNLYVKYNIGNGWSQYDKDFTSIIQNININEIIYYNDFIFCATSNGALKIDVNTSKYVYYHFINGTNDEHNIYFDKHTIDDCISINVIDNENVIICNEKKILAINYKLNTISNLILQEGARIHNVDIPNTIVDSCSIVS